MLFLSLLCGAVVAGQSGVTPSAKDDLSGFTLKQLDVAVNESGVAKQKLYSILTFDSDERLGANIAVLSSSHSGWYVVVLHRVSGGLKVEWRSGKLSDDFAVSSSSNLMIEDAGSEQVVKFSGCSPHQCGGVNGVEGVLIYSTRLKEVFFAHYRYDERKPIGSFGSLEFSENATKPGNERYKAALQKAMNTLLHQ
jgi:hypothetical protein